MAGEIYARGDNKHEQSPQHSAMSDWRCIVFFDVHPEQRDDMKPLPMPTF
jgi:hypothetical protein